MLGEKFFLTWLFDFVLVAVTGYNTSITAGDDAVHELAMIAHTSRSDAYIYLVFLACGGIRLYKEGFKEARGSFMQAAKLNHLLLKSGK
ncbi:hypothetical protein [Aquitalea pelogenes]|uniref:hypothetical protein n=1 Tax=Aquitalea pelogenes TaxID=1293573 RepID=UPI00128EFFBD|nr:hypothetical protein [Aquitalea pelogenes]